MIGAHDMGGMHHPEPVRPTDADWRMAPWELTVQALSQVGRLTHTDWNGHQMRHLVESLPAVDYLTVPYYVRILHALEVMYAERGYFSAEELAQRRREVRDGADPAGYPSAVEPAEVAELASVVDAGLRRNQFVPLADAVRRYAEGDAVRGRTVAHAGHTRIPRYTWGRTGRIVRYVGTHPLPDVAARRGERAPLEPVYQVVFDGRELWGDAAEPGTSVVVELYESYLEPAPAPPKEEP